MKGKKRIALVAHDQRKADLVGWVKYNAEVLSKHELHASGTTGKVIADNCSLDINRLKSGPLGGDQQLGAMIANGELDILIFFWDPMTAQPHDVDVKPCSECRCYTIFLWPAIDPPQISSYQASYSMMNMSLSSRTTVNT